MLSALERFSIRVSGPRSELTCITSHLVLASFGFSATFSIVAWLWIRSHDRDKSPLFRRRPPGGGPASDPASHSKGLFSIPGPRHNPPVSAKSEEAKRRAGEDGATSGLSRSIRAPVLRWRKRERVDQGGGSNA